MTATIASFEWLDEPAVTVTWELVVAIVGIALTISGVATALVRMLIKNEMLHQKGEIIEARLEAKLRLEELRGQFKMDLHEVVDLSISKLSDRVADLGERVSDMERERRRGESQS